MGELMRLARHPAHPERAVPSPAVALHRADEVVEAELLVVDGAAVAAPRLQPEVVVGWEDGGHLAVMPVAAPRLERGHAMLANVPLVPIEG